MYIAADCCSHKDTVHAMFSCTTAQHIYCTNTVQTVYSVTTVFTLITQKFLLHVQLHNSTAHLLYKYCTNCTFYN
jgi:hypothetical protein